MDTTVTLIPLRPLQVRPTYGYDRRRAVPVVGMRSARVRHGGSAFQRLRSFSSCCLRTIRVRVCARMFLRETAK